jgi:hypothetical protein
MTVKAVALISSIRFDGTGPNFRLIVNYSGLDSTPGCVDSYIEMFNVDPSITSATFEAGVKQAVKNDLTTNHGYTFGLFDTVRLIGATL